MWLMWLYIVRKIRFVIYVINAINMIKVFGKRCGTSAHWQTWDENSTLTKMLEKEAKNRAANERKRFSSAIVPPLAQCLLPLPLAHLPPCQTFNFLLRHQVWLIPPVWMSQIRIAPYLNMATRQREWGLTLPGHLQWRCSKGMFIHTTFNGKKIATSKFQSAGGRGQRSNAMSFFFNPSHSNLDHMTVIELNKRGGRTTHPEVEFVPSISPGAENIFMPWLLLLHSPL